VKHFIYTIMSNPRAVVMRAVLACCALTGLLAFVSPLRIVISIQPQEEQAVAAPAAIIPTGTPPPPTETTEPSPEPTETTAPTSPVLPPTATNTAEPSATSIPPSPTAIPTELPTEVPTEVPTEEPTEEPTPERDTDEVPTPQQPTTPSAPPTMEPPSATAEPPSMTAEPPPPTEVPAISVPPVSTPIPSNTPVPAPPVAPTIPVVAAPPAPPSFKQAPRTMPVTADPDEQLRLFGTLLPAIGLALVLGVMGLMVRRGAFRQRLEVHLRPQTAVATEQRYMAEIHLDEATIRARWLAGASVATLVEESAQRNPGVSRIALMLAVQRAVRD
jgi:hypothetical protein